MNKTDYVKECLKQLHNEKYYAPQRFDLTTRHKSIVYDTILDMVQNEEIHQKTFEYLNDGGLRTPIFYTLPKIHKGTTPPPGRPIISSIDSPTEKISHMLDLILQPFVEDMRSHIKDTPDFLRKIKELPKILPEDILFTMDVTGLYTNIPQ